MVSIDGIDELNETPPASQERLMDPDNLEQLLPRLADAATNVNMHFFESLVKNICKK